MIDAETARKKSETTNPDKYYLDKIESLINHAIEKAETMIYYFDHWSWDKERKARIVKYLIDEKKYQVFFTGQDVKGFVFTYMIINWGDKIIIPESKNIPESKSEDSFIKKSIKFLKMIREQKKLLEDQQNN